MSLFDKVNLPAVISTIALDTRASVSNSGTQGTTMTRTITIGTGSNRALFVCLNTDPSVTVSHIKLDGVAFTEISGTVRTGVGKNSIWQLMNPASGAGTITVTWGASAGYVSISAISFTGVDQTNPVNTGNITSSYVSTGGSAIQTVSITPANAGSAILGYVVTQRNVYTSTGSGSIASTFLPSGETSSTLGGAGFSQYDLSPTIGSANNLVVYTHNSAPTNQDRVIIEINRSNTVANQRVVENFSGSMVDTDRWTNTGFGAGAGNTTFTIDDEVDGGALMLVSSGNGGEGIANFNNIRQFSNTGSVFICVTKSNDVASGQNSRVGLKHGTDVTFNGGQLAGTENGYNVTSISSFCADASGYNRTNTSLGRDSSYHTFKGELTASDYKLTVDGLMETTDTTNLPTVRLQPFLYKAFNSGYTSSSSTRYYEAYNT